jgi:hypothetical protein
MAYRDFGEQFCSAAERFDQNRQILKVPTRFCAGISGSERFCPELDRF